MDKNGKIGGKVSIIDILVVVLVVAVIVGLWQDTAAVLRVRLNRINSLNMYLKLKA